MSDYSDEDRERHDEAKNLPRFPRAGLLAEGVDVLPDVPAHPRQLEDAGVAPAPDDDDRLADAGYDPDEIAIALSPSADHPSQ